jgi:carbonic anhydrase
MVSRCLADDLISPINISKNNVLSDCNLKCSLVTNYNTSSVNVHNKGSYLSLDYEANAKSNYHIKFNSIKMNVNEIRIYFPSIHTYNNSQTDGEMLIIHSGNGSNCVVSIPIIGQPSTTHGEKTLSTILENVKTSVPNINESTTLNISNFDVSTLLHLNVPYYYYQGQLVFEPCTQNYNYIVFDKSDYALHIDALLLQQLKNNFKQTQGTVAKNKDLKNLSYNKTGATSVELRGKDDIYIECKPLDMMGNVELGEDMRVDETPMETKTKKSKLTFEELSKNPAFDIVVSFVGMFILYSAGKYALSYIKSRDK